MFEYIMAEIPVIVSNLYEMKKIVEENNIGFVALRDDIESLKEAIEKTDRLDPGEFKNNIQKVKKIYNWEEQEKVLFSLYKDILE